ncbi:Distal membrane-arm assembly complex protein 1 [Lemmus lemmus]
MPSLPPAIPPAKTAAPTSVVPDSSSKNCWSCRLLSGSALLGAGVYVYLLGQRPLKRGLPVQPGTIAQMALGVCIACFGVVVLVDPKKRSSHQV